MYFLISNGGQGRDHHVEAVEPRPALDVVVASGANQHHHHEEYADFPEMTKCWHRKSGISGQWSAKIGGQDISDH